MQVFAKVIIFAQYAGMCSVFFVSRGLFGAARIAKTAKNE
jgi:hypothetical protein